ncbi:hypothetical protein SANTM175S_01576 [Streptomyces antimycoticus]
MKLGGRSGSSVLGLGLRLGGGLRMSELTLGSCSRLRISQ